VRHCFAQSAVTVSATEQVYGEGLGPYVSFVGILATWRIGSSNFPLINNFIGHFNIRVFKLGYKVLSFTGWSAGSPRRLADH
jgi:hypothetical protein